MTWFDTLLLIVGSNMITYWLIVKNNKEKQDTGGLVGLAGVALFASALGHHLFY